MASVPVGDVLTPTDGEQCVGISCNTTVVTTSIESSTVVEPTGLPPPPPLLEQPTSSGRLQIEELNPVVSSTDRPSISALPTSSSSSSSSSSTSTSSSSSASAPEAETTTVISATDEPSAFVSTTLQPTSVEVAPAIETSLAEDSILSSDVPIASIASIASIAAVGNTDRPQATAPSTEDEALPTSDGTTRATAVQERPSEPSLSDNTEQVAPQDGSSVSVTTTKAEQPSEVAPAAAAETASSERPLASSAAQTTRVLPSEPTTAPSGDDSDNRDEDDDSPKDSDTSFLESPEQTGNRDQDQDQDVDAVASTSSASSEEPLITTTFSNGVASTIRAEPTTSSTSNDLESIGSNGSSAGSQTPTGAIVGGVIGGVAALAFVAFLLWFCRRRRSKRDIARNSVLEPPDTKMFRKTWEFDNGSVGPTPRAAKFAAVFSHKVDKIGQVLMPAAPASNNGINMNRGNSQFIEPIPPRPRSQASISPDADEAVTTKDRFRGWFSGMRTGSSDTVPSTRAMEERRVSASSTEVFPSTLGAKLGLDRGRALTKNPFSDANAVQKTPSRIDPFADPEAARPTSSVYPKSRTVSPGQSMLLAPNRGDSRSPSSRPQSVNHLGMDRSKFRSDPFDLEFSFTPDVPFDPSELSRPSTANPRTDGEISRYPSVSSLGEWFESEKIGQAC